MYIKINAMEILFFLLHKKIKYTEKVYFYLDKEQTCQRGDRCNNYFYWFIIMAPMTIFVLYRKYAWLKKTAAAILLFSSERCYAHEDNIYLWVLLIFPSKLRTTVSTPYQREKILFWNARLNLFYRFKMNGQECNFILVEQWG